MAADSIFLDQSQRKLQTNKVAASPRNLSLSLSLTLILTLSLSLSLPPSLPPSLPLSLPLSLAPSIALQHARVLLLGVCVSLICVCVSECL
jgi:hypothetical protein